MTFSCFREIFEKINFSTVFDLAKIELLICYNIMKKIVLSVFAAGLVLASCSKEQKTEDVTSNVENVAEATPSDSLAAGSVVGVYEGTIPCADCEGIKTELDIKADDTYELDSEYLGKANGKFEEKGKVVWDETKTFATLESNDPLTKSVYYFSNGEAHLVTKVGDNATKPEYKLTKKN